MAEIVNLRQERKHKRRAAKVKQAEENRAVFGRSKAEKARDVMDAEQARKHLDGHKREGGDKAS